MLVARTPMTAAATRKMLQASRPREKPAVSAVAAEAWEANRCWVWLVASAVKIARPKAPPSCWEALSREAARPALSAGTPALAAVVTATNTGPRPSDRMSIPGNRSALNEPWTGRRDSQYTPPAAINAPPTMSGRVPIRPIS